MRKEYASLRRRMFLTPVWILVVGGAIAIAVAAWTVLAASTTLVVVVRHAEKTSEAGADPPLSAAGLERAARLAALFATAPGGQGVDAIFVTQWRRTDETARPLATRSGIPVVALPADDLAALERRILEGYRGRRVLVIGHADTVPQIVRRLVADPAELDRILAKGAERARSVADPIVAETKRRVGFWEARS